MRFSGVSVPQASSTYIVRPKMVYNGFSGVSVPQASSTLIHVATSMTILFQWCISSTGLFNYHNGWYVCDGSGFSGVSVPQASSTFVVH